ncbi:endolytic transglycosylase MltG [Erysipelotrichaceae bacterium OttesenSCG-928-M19]|nr:endolytic transglycosylase MltG [Erysipelotrichaceae bacterium OttesenSCG-928-M19]
MNNRKPGKKRLVLISILVVLLVIFGAVNYFSFPVNSNTKSAVAFSVAENETTDEILNNLQKEDLIKSKTFAKVYIRLSGKSDFKAGIFELSQNQSLFDIIEQLNTVSTATNQNITFLEGYRIIDFAKVAEEKLEIKQDDFLKLCNDQDFIKELQGKYELLKIYEFNDQEIYKLEGLLAPDTYNVSNSTTARSLIEVLVAQSNKKYLENKALFDKSKLSINEVYTLASMAEAEAKTYDDRVLVASIFMNRIKKGVALGSDVTTYYGLQIDMASRDLTAAELAEQNGYNTRADMNGLPVGPINAPSNDSILAALNYTSTNYLYFVSDKNGKIYATKTYAGHNRMIDKLKEDGLWFEY